jgi:hypothetical protein
MRKSMCLRWTPRKVSANAISETSSLLKQDVIECPTKPTHTACQVRAVAALFLWQRDGKKLFIYLARIVSPWRTHDLQLGGIGHYWTKHGIQDSKSRLKIQCQGADREVSVPCIEIYTRLVREKTTRRAAQFPSFDLVCLETRRIRN